MRFYITTPIYYVNDRPHIGHAYTTLAADVFARHHRFLGDDVFFLTGTDEHGAKIEESANKAGIDPQKFCNEKAEIYKNIWKTLNIFYDNFIRTTNENHIKAVESTLQELHNEGLIEKGFYKGFYCKGCEQYKTKSDLIDGKCPDHQTEPILIEEESYFFKMSRFQQKLKEKIGGRRFKEKKPGSKIAVMPELVILPGAKANEAESFLKTQKLEDISISRKNVKWGIPLPFDKTHTCYVWVDAFLNYLTGLGWKGPATNITRMEIFKKYWPPDIQLMGKDILRVHTTIWPSLLLALNLPLPKKICAHGFFTIEGKKMSKSLGNVIWPEDLVSKYGVDATRYLLLSFAPFNNDRDISLKQIEEKYNADLVNGIGNIVSRFIGLFAKNPQIQGIEIDCSNSKISRYMKCDYLDELAFWGPDYPLMTMIQPLIGGSDRIINNCKLWEKPETKKEHIVSVAGNLLVVALHLRPYMPDTAKKILESLGFLEFQDETWPEIEKEIQKQPIRKLKIKPLEKQLFPRF